LGQPAGLPRFTEYDGEALRNAALRTIAVARAWYMN
jgi:hypothetical protein